VATGLASRNTGPSTARNQVELIIAQVRQVAPARCSVLAHAVAPSLLLGWLCTGHGMVWGALVASKSGGRSDSIRSGFSVITRLITKRFSRWHCSAKCRQRQRRKGEGAVT
jgi:hypothetical protein